MSQLPLKYPSTTSYRSEDYIVTAANQRVHAQLVSGLSAGIGSLLFGPEASGKSHLLSVWASVHGGMIIGAMSDISAIPRGCYVAVDGIDALIGTKKGETWLFHLFNWQKEQGGQLLLTAQQAPQIWQTFLPDWRSRAETLDHLQLLPPDDVTLEIILTKMAADRQLRLAPHISTFIVRRMERTYQAARDLIQGLDQASLEEGKAINRPLVKKVMMDLGYPE